MLKIKDRIINLSVKVLALIAITMFIQVSTAHAQFAPIEPTAMDFNGDGKAEATLYDRSIGVWFTYDFVTETQEAVPTGKGNHMAVPADYDGDGRADYAVNFDQEDGTKVWLTIFSSTNTKSSFHWGTAGDVLVPGDYDGDKFTDYAVYRQGTWYILQSLDNKLVIEEFGLATDRPAQADYNGDGLTDIAVFRADTNMLYSLHSNSGTAFNASAWSNPVEARDITIPADYDGDGKTDFAVYGASNGIWMIFQSSTETYRAVQFGMGFYAPIVVNEPTYPSANADMPMPADYDGDGQTDIAVFNSDTHVVHVLASTAGYMTSKPMGSKNSIPVSTLLIGQ